MLLSYQRRLPWEQHPIIQHDNCIVLKKCKTTGFKVRTLLLDASEKSWITFNNIFECSVICFYDSLVKVVNQTLEKTAYAKYTVIKGTLNCIQRKVVGHVF